MATKQIFLQMRKRIQIRPGQNLRVKDVADILAENKEEIENLPINRFGKHEGKLAVVELMDVLQVIQRAGCPADIRTIGPPQTLVEFKTPAPIPGWLAVAGVWSILFVGSGLAIMNFHTDVSMKEVHERIFYLMTGVKKSKPLILQIPYSFGIGLGMVLFFNHVFRKKFNDEPTPLELEVFLYQENIDQYVIDHEKSQKRRDSGGSSG